MNNFDSAAIRQTGSSATHFSSRALGKTNFAIWRLAAVTCLLGSTAITDNALAQTQGAGKEDASAGGIEEIVVTARKVEENLQTTPIAVSAYTAATLQERNFKDVTDLATSTPNLVLQTSGANGSSKTPAIYLRGLGQADTVLTADPAVGLYVDGVYVARNVGSILDLIDLERVEVLRGPQGTLFGKNTIGGAISLISQKPKPEFGGSAELTVGDYSRFGGKASINVPFSDRFFVRLTGYGNKQDGYVDLVNYKGREFGDDNTWAVRGQARWLATDNLTVDLAADYSSTRNTGSAGVLLKTYPGAITAVFYNLAFSGNPACLGPAAQATNPACFGPVQVPTNPYKSNAIFIDRNLNKVSPLNAFDSLGATLTVKLDLPFGALQSISSYRNLRSDYSADGGLFGKLFFESLADRQDSDQYSQELQLSGTAIDNRLKWIAGGYYLYETTFSHVDVLSALAVAPFLRTVYPLLTDNTMTTHTYNTATFGQATFDITRRLHLTAGLRWTHEKKDARIVLLPATPGGLDGKLAVNKATPLVSLGLDLADNVFGYVSYSEGFRSGGFPPRIIGQISTIPAYGPETAKAIEAGIKAELLDHRLRANLAVFTTKFGDFQGFGTLPNVVPPFGTIINAGDARIKGFELELTAAPSRFFRVDASLSHLRSRVTRSDPTGNVEGQPVPVGSKLPFAPSWKASAGASWTIPFGNGSELLTRADVSLTSDMAFSLIKDPETTQDGIVLVNASMTYTFPNKNWQIVAGVKNLTDEFYYTSIGKSRNTTGTLTGTLAAPRTVFGSLRWRF